MANRHHKVADLMAKMHKFSDDKKCFGQRHDDKDAIQKYVYLKTGFIINDRKDQLNYCNTKQNPKRSPNALLLNVLLSFAMLRLLKLIC